MFLVFPNVLPVTNNATIECLCPLTPTPNSYVEIITPHLMVLGGEAFGMQLAH